MFSTGTNSKLGFGLHTHFLQAEDFPIDKGNGADRLIKCVLKQALIKENQILAEPFKIQIVVGLVSSILLPFNRLYRGTVFL